MRSMKNPMCGLQTVDQAMSMEVLRRGTELSLPDATATAGLKMSATRTDAICS